MWVETKCDSFIWAAICRIISKVLTLIWKYIYIYIHTHLLYNLPVIIAFKNICFNNSQQQWKKACEQFYKIRKYEEFFFFYNKCLRRCVGSCDNLLNCIQIKHVTHFLLEFFFQCYLFYFISRFVKIIKKPIQNVKLGKNNWWYLMAYGTPPPNSNFLLKMVLVLVCKVEANRLMFTQIP